MNKAKDVGFMAGIIFLALVIAGGAFLFLINPALTERSQAVAAQQSAIDFNSNLSLRLEQYQKEAEQLPQIREEIAQIRTELAPQEDVPAVRREIAAILAAESITVRSETVSLPGLVVPGQTVLSPSAYAVGRTSATDPLQFQDLFGTAIDMQLEGTYPSIVRAIAKIQMTEGRYYLVTNLSIAPDIQAGEGMYLATVQIYFFTLVDESGSIDPGTASDNVDPETGERAPDATPGDALRPIVPWVGED